MSKDMINEINNLTAEELKIIIDYKSHLFSDEEMKAVKERLNQLSVDNNKIPLSSNDTKLSSQLRQYNLSDGELDNLANTRILLGIFKCVNTIKNILIFLLVCGVAGIVVSFIK